MLQKATYNRKKRTDKPSVHLRSPGFCDTFGDCCGVCGFTGARPGEVRNAEAHNYQKGRLVFRWNTQKGYVHKTAKKTQRDRVIFLTPEAQAYTEECIKKYPEGPIFRSLRRTSGRSKTAPINGGGGSTSGRRSWPTSTNTASTRSVRM